MSNKGIHKLKRINVYKSQSIEDLTPVEETVAARTPKEKLAEFLESSVCEFVVGTLIVANTLVMAAEMQYIGMSSGYVTNFPGYEDPAEARWPDADKVFVIVERIFTSIFTVELVVRLAIVGRKLLLTPINWIDFLAVLVGLLDWCLNASSVVNPMLIRLLRLAKLARGLRLIKLTKVLGPLHLLLKCITSSVMVLSWSVCLLIVLQCIAGMVMSQLVHHFIVDETKDLDARREVFSYFGTFSRAMITMFEVHLANFAPTCRVLVRHVGEEYAFIFLAYRCLAGFAVLNVINAVFVQQTMKVAQDDLDVMIAQQEKQKRTFAKHIQALFKALDTSGEGVLTFDELLAAKQHPDMLNWMQALGINMNDVEALFRIIDINGDRMITADELLAGATRLKGDPKSVDILQVLAQIQMANHRLDQLVGLPSGSYEAHGEAFEESRVGTVADGSDDERKGAMLNDPPTRMQTTPRATCIGTQLGA